MPQRYRTPSHALCLPPIVALVTIHRRALPPNVRLRVGSCDWAPVQAQSGPRCVCRGELADLRAISSWGQVWPVKPRERGWRSTTVSEASSCEEHVR